MKREFLPLDSLPAWMRLNGITMRNVAVKRIVSGESGIEKGNAIVATADTEYPGHDAPPEILLQIPRDLVLSLEAVQNYSKSDHDLHEVLEAVGEFGRTMRGSIMILLLVQMTHNSLQGSRRVGVSNPWTEYVKFLPTSFSLPTLWSEDEQELLRGTSLEAATDAKLNSLQKEFESLHQVTEDIPWCKNSWWSEGEGSLTLHDWKYVDAAYRSRMLDLPGSGHSMVPCIDMVNHLAGPAAKALYDADADGNPILQLRQATSLRAGEEVTITYGDQKSASEMIFSYGFLDVDMTETTQLTLDVKFPEDDPLGIAKQIICKETPGMRILASKDSSHSNLALSPGPGVGDAHWDSPLIWWLSVNEEDGLEIGVAQTTDGGRELEAKWKGTKVESSNQLADFIAADPLVEVFQLRAVVLVIERLESQLFVLHQADQALESLRDQQTLLANLFRPEIFELASRLRELETTLLKKTVEDLTQQKNELMKSEVVTRYLNEYAQAGEPEVEDFS